MINFMKHFRGVGKLQTGGTFRPPPVWLQQSSGGNPRVTIPLENDGSEPPQAKQAHAFGHLPRKKKCPGLSELGGAPTQAVGASFWPRLWAGSFPNKKGSEFKSQIQYRWQLLRRATETWILNSEPCNLARKPDAIRAQDNVPHKKK
jgi:hypothetical protein